MIYGWLGLCYILYCAFKAKFLISEGRSFARYLLCIYNCMVDIWNDHSKELNDLASLSADRFESNDEETKEIEDATHLMLNMVAHGLYSIGKFIDLHELSAKAISGTQDECRAASDSLNMVSCILEVVVKFRRGSSLLIEDQALQYADFFCQSHNIEVE